MGDDDARRLGRAQLVHALGNDAHGVDVEAGVGLVENGQRGLEHRHLENLVAFLLATAESFVHRTARELRVEIYNLALLVHELDELGGLQLGQSLCLALLVDGSLQEVRHRHTGYLHRILERQEQSLVGALLGFHLQEVLAVVPRFALGDLVERIAHEHRRERRLTRAVRAHDGMRLAISDDEVDALQYFFASNRGVQVLYF